MNIAPLVLVLDRASNQPDLICERIKLHLDSVGIETQLEFVACESVEDLLTTIQDLAKDVLEPCLIISDRIGFVSSGKRDFSAVEMLKRQFPLLKVIAYSGSATEAQIHDWEKKGLLDVFCRKSTDAMEVCNASSDQIKKYLSDNEILEAFREVAVLAEDDEPLIFMNGKSLSLKDVIREIVSESDIGRELRESYEYSL